MKIRFLLIFFAVFLLLGGCITVENYHKQNPDGSAEVSMNMDLSTIMELSAGFGQDAEGSGDVEVAGPDKEEFEAICDEVANGVDCVADADDWTIVLTKTFEEGSFYELAVEEELTKKKYTLVIDELPNYGDIGDEETGELPSGKLTDPANSEQAPQLKASGMKWTYVVEMPGEITSAPDGDISKDKKTVEFDIIELMGDEQEIVVESVESGFFCTGPAVLLLIAGFAAFIYNRK